MKKKKQKDKCWTSCQLPSNFPLQAVKEAMELVITYILLCVTTFSNGVICTSTKNVELLGYLISLYWDVDYNILCSSQRRHPTTNTNTLQSNLLTLFRHFIADIIRFWIIHEAIDEARSEYGGWRGKDETSQIELYLNTSLRYHTLIQHH